MTDLALLTRAPARSVSDQMDDARIVAARVIEALAVLAMLPERNRPSGWRLSCEADGKLDSWREPPERVRFVVAPDAIDRLDETLGWLALLAPEPERLRRAVYLRSLTDPVTGRRRFGWQAIGALLDCAGETARLTYHEAIDVLVLGLRRRGTVPTMDAVRMSRIRGGWPGPRAEQAA